MSLPNPPQASFQTPSHGGRPEQQQPHAPRRGFHGPDRRDRDGPRHDQSIAQNLPPVPVEQHSLSLRFRPPSVRPNSRPPASGADRQNSSERGLQRGYRGRGRGRHQTRQIAPKNANGRPFEGNLTNGNGELVTPTVRDQSQASAPAIVTDQQITASGTSNKTSVKSAQRRRRPSKSSAQDITSRIQEDIDNRQYECPICTNEVLRSSKIWSCQTCWTVFHLSCVKQWSSNADSAVLPQQLDSDEMAPSPKWRCPGCNLPQDVKPNYYSCWCGKDHDPRSIIGLPPHSCGQTCGRQRGLPKKCPHPCDRLCHAGPCPPCTNLGPKQTCYCGKEIVQRKCADTKYDCGWSCGKPCGDSMPCGEHTCQRPCHEGLCGGCETRLDARCYCGKNERSLMCCDREDEMLCRGVCISESGEQSPDEWTGIYCCGDICDSYYDCGKHKCEKLCHVRDSFSSHCPRSPDSVTECPCGKTSLTELLQRPRDSCEVDIPHCGKKCLKPLNCGHLCQYICHVGPCMLCVQNTTIYCRCQRTAINSVCHQGSEEPPQCVRVCRITLNCGRHECGERCCTGERKATERMSVKKKNRPLAAELIRTFLDPFEPEHICTRICGRPLKCGHHYCQELCHKGPCGTCPEAIFNEVTCHCGRTILQPPLPCGTKPPPCRWECERPKACGHPQIPHNCHPDSEPCPKCPFLTEKRCLCGKKHLNHQQCWFTEVRCGETCSKQLKCGIHTCRKTCHRAGDCESSQQDAALCKQTCGKPKQICGHPCEDQCHAPYPCKQDKPCSYKIFTTCACQNKKQESRCAAAASSPEGNNTKSLTCDDECARLERNRRLANALDIDPSTHSDDYIPYSAETLNLFQEVGAKWAEANEREFRVFAGTETEMRLRFRPMPSAQRSFLHALAEDFGLDSESVDPEPHRHVAVFKTPRFVGAPSKTVRDALRIRARLNVQRGAETLAKASDKGSGNVTLNGSRSGKEEVYNGFLVTMPRFALTQEELYGEASSVLNSKTPIELEIHFIPSGDVALLAKPTSNFQSRASLDGDPTKLLTQILKNLKLPLSRALSMADIGKVQLCHLSNTSWAGEEGVPSVLALEADIKNDGTGWSQVAAKAAAPKEIPRVKEFGAKSGFAVLGSVGSSSPGKASGGGASTAAKKKRDKEREKRRKKALGEAGDLEIVADSWEVEMERVERAEKGEELDGHGGDAIQDPAGASETSTTAAGSMIAVQVTGERAEDGRLREKQENGEGHW